MTEGESQELTSRAREQLILHYGDTAPLFVCLAAKTGLDNKTLSNVIQRVIDRIAQEGLNSSE